MVQAPGYAIEFLDHDHPEDSEAYRLLAER
jgi:hypothetical protein